MKFAGTLTDPDGNIFMIAEFAGMTEGYLSLERHPDFHTVQEFFNATMHAFGQNVKLNGGRDWLKGVEDTHGVDAIITANFTWDFNFSGVFETLYNGIIAVGLFIETLDDDHFLQLTISQSIWWQKFLKRLDTKINIQSVADVDGNPVTPMNYKPITLTTQKINKSYIAYSSKNAVVEIPAGGISNPIYMVGFDQEELKEIEEQSSITPTLISAGNTALYPDLADVVPFWNLTDQGDFTLSQILLTMSFGGVDGSAHDPNHAAGNFINAKNNKCFAVTDHDLFIQKNSEAPIKFSKSHRNVALSFLRNDGVLESLNTAVTPQVTDFTLPTNTVLRINKYDAVRIYMINTSLPGPLSDTSGMLFIWGQDGWDHSSGFDQLRNGQGCFMKDSGVSTHYSSNRGALSFGGIFNAANNLFPDHIDNDAGLNQNITAGNFWTIGEDTPGVLGGTVVTGINVLTALVNMTAGDPSCQNPANWSIGVLTPYEGLEIYAIASTSFQGYFNPIAGNFPTTEKDGVSAIKFADRWFITALNTNLQGAYVDSTYIIQALLDAPGNIRANWWVSTRAYYDQYYLTDLQFQGNWDASVNLYPAVEFGGAAIIADDIWIVSTAGTFGGGGGIPVDVGDVIRARVNAPGQVNANWDVFTLEQWQTYAKANLKVFNGIKVTFETTYPDSVAQGFLLHDVGTALCDRITGRVGLFLSGLFGNAFTSKIFGATGNFSLFALFKGLQIRGYDLIEKPFFYSMKEFWEGLNNIACLAMGRYVINGQDQIVVKSRAEAYDPTMVVKLNWVQHIKRTYTNEEQYTSIDLGYSTWESKNGGSGEGISSGVDDFQTQQSRNTLFKNVGKKLTIFSDLIAAGLNIESTRRITNKQTANYQYDNNTFIIALNNNCSKPELSENFSEIDNVLNPTSRYNIRLSTFRNFVRHLDYLSACMQKNLTSFFRFGDGKGNYLAATKASSNYLGDQPGVLLQENQDINPSANPMFIDQTFTIEHDLDWTCYKLLRDNPDKAIGVSQTDKNHVPFFIKDLKWFYAQGKVTLVAKPKTKFNIQTIVYDNRSKVVLFTPC